MIDNFKYIKEDIEREVGYAITDYKYGAISADKLETLLNKLEELKAVIDNEIEKIYNVLHSAPPSKPVLFPEENLYTPPPTSTPPATATISPTSPYVKVTLPTGLSKLEEKIPAIVERYGLSPEQVKEIIRILLE